jgi:hypothetical protein
MSTQLPVVFDRSGKDEEMEVLVLDPPKKLTFNGFLEFGRGATEKCAKLWLFNLSNRVAYFNVKRKAPRIFFVFPSRGVIQPSSCKEVTVFFTPVEYPSKFELKRANHKFTIESAFAPSDTIAVSEFWKSVNPEDVECSKISAVFDYFSIDDEEISI